MAAFNVDLIGACERIRKEASTLAGENYAFNLKKKTGALDFITSPENGGVDSSLVSWDGGRKVGTLKILYDQRTKSCQVGTDNASVCDTGSRPARKQALINIDDFIHTPVRTFTNDDMVVICKDTATFVRERLTSDITAAHEKLSELILAELLAMRGKNYEFDGSTTAAGANKTSHLILISKVHETGVLTNCGFILAVTAFKIGFTGLPCLIFFSYANRIRAVLTYLATI